MNMFANQMPSMPGGAAPHGVFADYMIPQWEERTSYGVRRIDPYTKLFEDRIIFLGSPISDDVANAVMSQLLCLQSMDPERKISLYINSPGADGDLRHHEVHQARDRDDLFGSSCFCGSGDSGCRLARSPHGLAE